MTGDAARSAGLQDITLINGGQVGTIEVRLVHNTAYFRGNKLGLMSYLGLPTSLAADYTGRWISVARSNQAFASIAASMTIKAVIAQIVIDGPLTMSSGPSAPSTTLILEGTSGALSAKGQHGPATLVVSDPSTPLPVSFSAQGKDGSTMANGSVSFSNWGESVAVVAPAHAVPNTSIGSG